MKKIFLGCFLLSGILFLSACSRTKGTATNNACPIGSGVICTTDSGSLGHSDLTQVRKQVTTAIKDMDLTTLATFVGDKGLRFSPYQHVNTGTDVVFSKEIISGGLSLNRSFNWGLYDGSGLPIDLGIGQYFDAFVYDVDFANAPQVFHNQEITRGTIVNNIFQVYKNKEIYEYYFSGFDAKYEGMDWRSLTLVFEQVKNQWYLLGIIHGARTS